MKSQSRRAPRVSRRRKTGVLPGLRQEANPKPAGDSKQKRNPATETNPQANFAIHQQFSREAISPLAGK